MNLVSFMVVGQIASVLITNFFDTTVQGRPDAMQRAAVVTENHVYKFRGQCYTNCVGITTNLTQLRLQWVELPVTQELKSGCVTRLWLIGTEVVHGSDSNTVAAARQLKKMATEVIKEIGPITAEEAKAKGLPPLPKK